MAGKVFRSGGGVDPRGLEADAVDITFSPTLLWQINKFRPTVVSVASKTFARLVTCLIEWRN